MTGENRTWKWIIENKERACVLLDNDVTYVDVDGDEFQLADDSCVGNAVGVYELLEAIGIECEGV